MEPSRRMRVYSQRQPNLDCRDELPDDGSSAKETRSRASHQRVEPSHHQLPSIATTTSLFPFLHFAHPSIPSLHSQPPDALSKNSFRLHPLAPSAPDDPAPSCLAARRRRATQPSGHPTNPRPTRLLRNSAHRPRFSTVCPQDNPKTRGACDSLKQTATSSCVCARAISYSETVHWRR